MCLDIIYYKEAPLPLFECDEIALFIFPINGYPCRDSVFRCPFFRSKGTQCRDRLCACPAAQPLRYMRLTI